MDDVLKRLGVVESTVSDTRAQVSAIAAVLPHLATKAELTAGLSQVRDEVAEVKTEVAALRGEMHSEVAALIRWIVGTAIASMVAASAIATVIARVVH